MFTCDIYNADCLEVLHTIPDKSIDCVWLDPPYNTKNKTTKVPVYERNKDFMSKRWVNFYAEWDDIDNYVSWCHSWLKEVKRILSDRATVFICGSFHNIPDVAIALRMLDMYTIQWICWAIPNSFPNLSMTKQINANQTIIAARKSEKITHYYDKEAAKRYNNGKNLRDYWIINQDTRGKWKHPSKKPFDLVYRAIDIAAPKDKAIHVLDFFSGSGTTGEVMAHFCKNYQTDVYCTLIEKDPIHAQTTLQRVNYGCQTSKVEVSRIQTFF